MPRVYTRTINREGLTAYQRDLKQELSRVDSLLKAFDEEGIDTLEVKNGLIGVRGLEYVSKFVQAIREAHLELRDDANVYFADDPKPAKKTAKAGAKK